MAELLFDTMAAVRRLRETGMEERQAEAITATVRDGLTGGVVTKPDMLELRAALKDDVVGLESRLKDDIAVLKDDMGGLESRLKGEIAVLKDDMAGLESRLRADMAVLKDDMVERDARHRAEMAENKRDMRLVQGIGGAILAFLIFPWLAELLSVALPGAT